IRQRPRSRWLADLERGGIPCGPINSIEQVLRDPHVEARAMKIDLPHPLAGSVPQVRAPLRFSGSPPMYTDAPPLLGQHSRDVLQQTLGLADDAFADLVARGIVGVPTHAAPTTAPGQTPV
ncbi:MAG TPA: CoA transferase, partial [Casimicrobiaceae bacterium]|nr:CoA transferase [Casimicrobiaceae bacterium]